MAWGHSTNMAPLEMSRIQSDKALLVVNAARRLQDKYSLLTILMNFFSLLDLFVQYRLLLSPEQAGLGLQTIDTRLSLLEDTCPRLPVCLLTKYRTYDGTCNNLRKPSWGSSLTPMERLASPEYGDGKVHPSL